MVWHFGAPFYILETSVWVLIKRLYNNVGIGIYTFILPSSGSFTFGLISIGVIAVLRLQPLARRERHNVEGKGNVVIAKKVEDRGREREREKEGEFPPEPIGCPNVQSVSLMQANEWTTIFGEGHQHIDTQTLTLARTPKKSSRAHDCSQWVNSL